MKNLHFLRTWLSIGLFLISSVFYLCLRDIHLTPTNIPSFDKLLHLTCYFLLSYYFSNIVIKKNFLKTTIPLIIMGILIEFLQRETGYRSFEYNDMVANTIGCLMGFTISRYIYADLLVHIEKYVLRVSR